MQRLEDKSEVRRPAKAASLFVLVNPPGPPTIIRVKHPSADIPWDSLEEIQTILGSSAAWDQLKIVWIQAATAATSETSLLLNIVSTLPSLGRLQRLEMEQKSHSIVSELHRTTHRQTIYPSSNRARARLCRLWRADVP